MSTNSLQEVVEGHIFELALQGISLKRFRLRYSSYDDCYYLHWDDPVCPPLAKINGLFNGVYYSCGIQRYKDEDSGQAYLGLAEGATEGKIEWVFDFSCCGLVINRMEMRSTYLPSNVESGIRFSITGNDSVYITPLLGDHYTNISQLAGCCRVLISIELDASSNDSVRLLNSSSNPPPLDILVDLMCPRRDDEIYAGELLLGLKFKKEAYSNGIEVDSTCTTTLDADPSDYVIVDSDSRAGHLQVHIVEGAGIVDEMTHKPFNTFVKCELLPDVGRFRNKHTSPKHNAYPTWAKEFHFDDVSTSDIVNGGLEVILYDHHKFVTNSNIGGLRLCEPKKHVYNEISRFSSDSSCQGSRSSSPTYSYPNGINSPSPVHLNITEADLHGRFNAKASTTLPRPVRKNQTIPNSVSFQVVSPSAINLSSLAIRRMPSPDGSYSHAKTLSPDMFRAGSPRGSPILNVKNFLIKALLSPTTSPRGSPRGSPIPSRKKFFSQTSNMESEYVFWWMENTPERETRHWKQVLEKDGKWIYFWHVIRPNLKSAY